MAFRALPLFEENDDEKRGHRKIYSLEVERNERSRRGADHRSRNPIDMIEQRYVKHALPLIDIRRVFRRAEDGIRLVRQGEDHIRIRPPRFAEFFDKRQTVEYVAAVHEKRHCKHRCERLGGCEQRHKQKLAAPRVNRQTAEKSPGGGIPCLNYHYPESRSEEEIPEKHRKRLQKSIFERTVILHLTPSTPLSHGRPSV